MNALKGYTALEANKLLGVKGAPFWQHESYDRAVRDGEEFNRVKRYIESDPVRSGRVNSADEYPWSSAYRDRSAR